MRSMRLSRYGGGSPVSRGSGCQGFLEKGWLPRRVAGCRLAGAASRGQGNVGSGSRVNRMDLSARVVSGLMSLVPGSEWRWSVSWRSYFAPPQNAVIAVIALKSP